MSESKYESHESYAMVSFSRVTSNLGENLNGSSIKNYNKIVLTISHGEKSRDLSQDRYMATEQILEIDLAPNQYTELLTSMNMGSGVPATLRRLNGKTMMPCPEVSKRQLFDNEFRQNLADIGHKLADLQKFADSLAEKKNVTKADKSDLQKKIHIARQDIESNLPYIHDTFNESMDKVVTEAKSEMDAAIFNTVLALGIDRLESSPKEAVNILTGEMK